MSINSSQDTHFLESGHDVFGFFSEETQSEASDGSPSSTIPSNRVPQEIMRMLGKDRKGGKRTKLQERKFRRSKVLLRRREPKSHPKNPQIANLDRIEEEHEKALKTLGLLINEYEKKEKKAMLKEKGLEGIPCHRQDLEIYARCTELEEQKIAASLKVHLLWREWQIGMKELEKTVKASSSEQVPANRSFPAVTRKVGFEGEFKTRTKIEKANQ